MVPRRDALPGNTFETRKISSRRPAMASAITSSASPYISAVSIWVMPRSMPRVKLATALLRSPRSIYQVPCPITDAVGPPPPNLRCFISMHRYRQLDATAFPDTSFSRFTCHDRRSIDDMIRDVDWSPCHGVAFLMLCLGAQVKRY